MELPGVVAAVKKFHKAMQESGASVSIEVAGETVYDSKKDDSDGPRIVDAEDDEPIVAKKLAAPKKRKT
jgi:hypothetical protein